MPETEQRAQSSLAKWLRANVLATIGLIIAMAGAVYAMGAKVSAVSSWVTTNENQIAVNAAELVRSTTDIQRLKENVVDIDRRLNEQKAQVLELHNLSDQADAALKARLDIIDALGKLTADRSFQSPLPLPYQPPRGAPR